jgi:hypothetical protein
MIAMPTGREPVFLPTSDQNRRFHRRWWTALPAIPATRECFGYQRLWRQFADHTMNTFSNSNGVFRPGSRGFYVEGREDHLVPAFFENFSLFPNFSWLERLLARLAIPCEGRITSAAWSYSYEEVLPGERRPRIADIVAMWQDDQGKAVLVIEAKKPRCGRTGIGDKDNPANGYYLKYREMCSFARRSQALLIDENDVRYLPKQMASTPAVVTWQELVSLQRNAAAALSITEDIRELLLSRLDGHYCALNLAPSQARPPIASGDNGRYDELRALNVPGCVRDWLVGSESYFAARNEGGIAEMPYGWLADEPAISDFASEKRQSTAHREKPVWRI